MICELFPFQKQAVNEMRLRVAMALNNYRMLKIPQVVSLQAPTGSGKTIIMSALIEDIFYGSEQFTEQPEAIFVWLSDSPQLNEQSKQKIELKADKVRMDQCVVISDESFDREILEDGHIYFLNTQKLGKAGNLSRHSDTRQYTIWETIENTAREKADRLYFIIDEAHRGMQGRQAGTATTIMQRFIKGSSEQNLSPIPVVIGMSATAERFNSLVGQATNSTLHKVVISPAQVRQSGLLKDRIVITYPEDPIKHGDMAVLQAATDEWQDKCKHWYQYTYEQHYPNVNPVFVIQVCAGSGTKVSDTDLDDVIAKIEERMGDSFKENEVVHTFGSTGTLSIHGLTVPHIEPSEIAEDRRIRVVLFKENLSTGWDCPRAETMMSFRRAEDATYIAQLLGRMVRTPLQCHVLVDDSLNDVRLFLPYFNQDTVQKVIDELQATEGGEIPTVVDGESLEDQIYDTWSVHTQRKKTQKQTVGQLSIFDYPNGFQEEPAAAPSTAVGDMSNSGAVAANQGGADSEISAEGQHQTIPLETVSGNDVHAGQEIEKTSGGNQSVNKEQPVLTPAVSQMSMLPTIDREGITKFINEQGYLTWINPLYNLIDEHLRLIDSYEEDFGEMGLDKVYQKYFSAFTREEFDAALLRRRQNIKEFTEIKQMEYNAITHHADPVYASNKKHFKAEEDPLPDYLLPYFKRVIRITRLREVRVLLGFTRVDAPDPDADEQTNIVYLNKGKTEKWLPAAEVHGEGVFIEFNRDSIDAWLRDPELGALSQKYAQCYKEFCESKEWTVTTLRDARYVLMHTFAHLLIKQMSMSSGYSSSAIRERIYFGDDMSGVLLYTGSADKEGSLGGLVELGNIDQLIVLMKDAFQEALVCTNDPECLNNVPAGNNSNGAACHSCCMISETACENGNRMLDRGLIVPIDGRENQSYFKTLVEELCQLEV